MGPIEEKVRENERHSWIKKSFLSDSTVRVDSKEKSGWKKQRWVIKTSKINWIEAVKKKTNGTNIKREIEKYSSGYRVEIKTKACKRKTNSPSKAIQPINEILIAQHTFKIVY